MDRLSQNVKYTIHEITRTLTKRHEQEKQFAHSIGLLFMQSLEVTITAERPDEEESQILLASLRAELAEKYPDELRGFSHSPDELMISGAVFLVARRNGKAVACGAIRPLGPGVAEVKRMFVVAGERGRGIGRKVLQRLELLAGEMGYSTIRLETGLKQPEAIALYETAGYKPYPCYGPYATNPLSACFEKKLRV